MAILASDDFSVGSALSGSWTQSGGPAWSIVSGRATKSSDGSDSEARWTALTWPNDQWAEAVLSSPFNGGGGLGYGVEFRSTGATTKYRLVGDNVSYELAKEVSGSFTSLGAGVAASFATGDRIYGDAQGTTITARKNTINGVGGTLITSVTDASIASGSAGIMYSAAESGNIESWQGGDFSATTGVITSGMRRYVGRNRRFTAARD